MPTPTSMPISTTNISITTPDDCKAKETNEFYAKVDAFTTLAVFRELTQSEQVYVYEVMAAVEGCNMKGFIDPETTERFLKLLLDLPLRYVPTFVKFVST